MISLAKIAARFALPVLLALSFVPAAQAQELSPEHLALARHYVDLTDKAQIYETTLVQIGIQTMRTIVSQNPEIADQVSTTIGDVIKTYKGQKDRLFDQFARVYALRFTEDELRQINAFYETDVGQKLAEQNGPANQDLQNVMQVFKRTMDTEFFAKVRAALKDQGIDI